MSEEAKKTAPAQEAEQPETAPEEKAQQAAPEQEPAAEAADPKEISSTWRASSALAALSRVMVTPFL